MAKSKTRKSQKQKQMVENEVLVYIYSLVLITLSIIGGLQIGFIGELTTSIIKYVFGNLYRGNLWCDHRALCHDDAEEIRTGCPDEISDRHRRTAVCLDHSSQHSTE